MFVTVLGGTGGCALAALTRLLKDNHDAVAVARTPAKLTKLLAEKGVSEQTTKAHLTIVEGDATDVAILRKALVLPGDNRKSTDMVLCAVGASPVYKASLTNPVGIDQPTLCGDVTRSLLQALAQLQDEDVEGKPSVAVVSTTGISDVQDVPFLLRGLYHWILAVPHKDKKSMETQFLEAAKAPKPPITGVTLVRPTLLTDGAGKGAHKIRCGWEGSSNGPATGYSVARDDVGAWIFENLIKSPDRAQWLGRMVTLTS